MGVFSVCMLIKTILPLRRLIFCKWGNDEKTHIRLGIHSVPRYIGNSTVCAMDIRCHKQTIKTSNRLVVAKRRYRNKMDLDQVSSLWRNKAVELNVKLRGVGQDQSYWEDIKVFPQCDASGFFFSFFFPCVLRLHPGGGTRMSRGYQARPKIHVIRVVFQDQALYARTSFRGAKTCKIWKEGCVLGHTDQFWKEHDRQIKKNACKNACLGSFFIPE